MGKITSIFSFLPGLLLSATVTSAQDSTLQETNKTSFRLGLFYNSNLNYYGRTDSLKSSGVFPMAELWFGNGFYLNAAPVFVHNAATSLDYAGTVTSAGYRTPVEEKLVSHVFLTVPVYRDNSELVQSALKAQFSSNFTWMNRLLNLTAGGDLKWSDRMDYGLTAGLDHLFRTESRKGFVLVLNPSAYLYAGTQRFNKTYYRKSSFLFLPGVEQQVAETVDRFSILSYEFSVPVVLAKGGLQLIASPAYVIPQNLLEVENRPDLSERGKPMFYSTLGIKYDF